MSLFDQENPDNLQTFIDEINNITDKDYYTVESFAWKLLIDDDDIEVLSSALKVLSDVQDSEQDPITFSFEIYSMLFCEMIFNMMNINFECENKDPDDEFYPDYKKNNLEDILDLLKNKFAKLHILLNISSINIDFKENVNIFVRQEYPNRYARIALVGNKYDLTFIEKKNYTDISSDNNKFYLNLLNNDFNKYIKQNYELKDLYNIIVVSDKIYKISFDFIKIYPYKI